MNKAATAVAAASDTNGFKYDPTNVEWHKFFTPGTWYRILNVDVAARTADMLVKFEPDSQCMYHRHAAFTSTLVLEGELRVHEQIDGGEVVKVKPAGSYSAGGEGEIHIEGSGHEQAIIFFGMRSDTDVIYELLNDDLSLKRAVTVADFDRDWRERWPLDRRKD
jgi:quercetin dioxygenase-like cupin family protein